MRILLFLLLLWNSAVVAQELSTAVVHLETNGARDPLGIDDVNPRLSWRLESTERNVMQQFFRVLIATVPERLAVGQADMWDSGRIETSEPFVTYAGPALAARTRYYWTVQVGLADGRETGWTPPAAFEMGLLHPDDWKAFWIAGPERSTKRITPEQGIADDTQIRAAGAFCRPIGWPEDGFFPRVVPNPEGECREIRPAPMLRNRFQVTKPVAYARVYTSGLGYNDLTINGRPVSDRVLDPGLTDYAETVLYTTFDVTGLLQPGENVVASVLGSGHFDSSTRTWDWGWDEAEWRATPRLRLQLVVTYTDGTEQVVVSDASWKVSTDGPYRYDSYYLGETYDARKVIPGWNAPGFDDSAWPAARVVEAPAGTVRAQRHEPIRIVSTRPAGKKSEPSPGVFVYDTGQNLSGWAQIRINAPAGTAIELFYSEKLDSTGRVLNDVGYALVGGRLQTDYYVSRGSGDEVWTPRFSYKGFQYLQVSGPNGVPLGNDVSVVVETIDQIRTDAPPTLVFETDNALLNRIVANTRWAVESNMMGLMTDTPIYEKNPWTGDAQLSAGVVATLFDAERLYGKMVRDMVDAQTEEGEVPLLAPSNRNYGYTGKPAFKPVHCCGATPAWDAFWFVIPWEAYQRYGDRTFLEQSYPAMQRYLDRWIPQWTGRDGDAYAYTLTSGLGDWDPPTDTPTNIALSSTAYYAHFAQIARDAARVLGRSDDANRYDTLFGRIRADFNARFLSPDGVYRDTTTSPFTQTAQVLPLAFGLAPDDQRSMLAGRVAADLADRGGNPYVGILGARYILPVLTEAGFTEAAFTAATQVDYPSWGYWIEGLGWTGLGEFWEATSRSRNHHFFGTIVQWMVEDLAGVRPLAPGYASIEFKPEIPAGLNHVSATYESIRGTVISSWTRTSKSLEYEITVPPNATGLVYLPAPDSARVTETAAGTRPARTENGRIVYTVGSGSYRFVVSEQ